MQETHSKPEDEKFWINQWGDKILFDHGSTRSAGVAVLFCNSPGKLITSRFSNNGQILNIKLICVLNIMDKWIEDGEKSTSYFCRLEKRRQEKLSVKALLIHGQVITDQASITKEVVNFYSNLYSSTFSLDDTKSFFDHIKDFIPHIDDDFVALCDADITSDELDKAVGSLSLDKSPGCDGLTANFYKHFWSILKEPFVLMLKEAIETSSNKRGSCFEGIRVCFYGVGQP